MMSREGRFGSTCIIRTNKTETPVYYFLIVLFDLSVELYWDNGVKVSLGSMNETHLRLVGVKRDEPRPILKEFTVFTRENHD